jgi:hypothetical protein
MGWRDAVLGGGVGYAVGGPAGAAIGVALAGGGGDAGYDLSDVPYGIYVEAEHTDDEEGRHWTLRFESEVPAESLAVVRLLDDAARPLRGRAPYVDDDGSFTAFAPIDEQSCVLFVPWDAIAYSSAKHVSLEVSVWSPAPLGKAVLDADLPARHDAKR